MAWIRKICRTIRDLPIQRKLIISFLLLIIFPAILIGTLSFYRSSVLIKGKTQQYTRDILIETGKNLEIKLEEAVRLSFQIVSNTDLNNSLRMINKGNLNNQETLYYERTIDTQLRELISTVPGIAAILVIPDNGDIYYINPSSLSSSTMYIDEEEKHILEKANGSVCWFDIDPDSRTIKLGRMINSPLNQEKIGYVFIYIRESLIFNTFSETGLFRSGAFLIINESGNIISCRDKNLLGQPNPYGLPEITDPSYIEGFSTLNIDGRNYYVSYRAINGTPWRMFSYIPALEYEKEIIRLRNWIGLIILCACILSVTFSIAISNGIAKPVQDLSQKMLKIGVGDFSVSSTYDSKDEIGVLSHHFNKMVEQVKQLIRKAYEEELLKQKAELKSLRMQINPHFLYNSLESINWMARMHGLPEVGKMVKALGDLMRASIGGGDFVTVEEEIRNINNYLTIQKFRYGDKVTAEIDIDPSIYKVTIPKLILQPIVENAIVHGIERKVGNGKITIKGRKAEGIILLQVEDDGMGMDENMIAGIFSENNFPREEGHTHIGLQNVDRRIKMYYGDDNHITITSRPGKGTVVRISIPDQKNMPV